MIFWFRPYFLQSGRLKKEEFMRQEETTTLREKLEEKSKAGTGHSVHNPQWVEFCDSVFTVKVHLLYGQTTCVGIKYAHAWFTTFKF